MTPETLRPFLPAVVFALLATLLGQGIGIAFGAAEDSVKGSLRADADAALSTVYGGDVEKAKGVADKSWAYLKRAHLHGGALGTAALAVTFLLAFLPGSLAVRRALAIGNGVGALGYGTFWLFAGLRAPSLGGTGVAKESLAWLALPSSGLLVVSTVGAVVFTLLALRPRAN